MTSNFLLRWTLANTLGWPAGFVLGALLARADTPLALVLAGGLAGAVAGLMQQIALRGAGLSARCWWLWTAVGVAAGTVAAFFAGLLVAGLALLLGSWLPLLAAVGAILGASAGAAQARYLPQPGRWIAVNALAGLLGGVLTLLGPLVFGLLTGLALRRQTDDHCTPAPESEEDAVRSCIYRWPEQLREDLPDG